MLMKEYKMLEVPKKDGEKVMNEMAQLGWEVVSMTCWNNWTIKLLITFAREKE